MDSFGMAGTIPVPGDYDGDGLADFAVYDPATSTWHIALSSRQRQVMTVQFGAAGDVPIGGKQ